MTDISAITGTTPAAASPLPASPTRAGASELDSDTFLKLLVAQLKYQDPTSPSDSTQFLAQTAQFTMVEKLTALTERTDENFTMNQNMSAAGLVGKTVTWITDDGYRETGVVDAARLGSAGAQLLVNGAEVPFSSVAEVAAGPDSSTSTV